MRNNRVYGGRALRIVFGITILVTLFLAGNAGAATLTVNANGGADYTRIQDAINNASAGDTINVAAGTYNENIVINKPINIIGAGAEVTIVNAYSSNMHVFNINADYVNISGFTVTGTAGGAPDYNSAGIYLAGANYANVSSNIALNNFIGITLAFDSNHNTLFNNIIDSNGDGITLHSHSNDNILTSNIISQSTGTFVSSEGDGIEIVGSDNNTIYNNTVNLNKRFGILLAHSIGTGSSINNTLIGNYVSNNYNGIFLSGISDNNTLSSNTVTNNYDGGIWIGSSSNNTLSANAVSNNGIGIKLGVNVYINTEPVRSINNVIYNNLFNNTDNFNISISINSWNTTKKADINTIGGPYLGGNFWANPSGTGFSQTCTDADGDGICDSSYTLDSSNIDYLPLTHIRYVYSGILQPIKADGSSIFELGSTVPVKFQLWDASGNFVTNAVAKIYVAKISDGIIGAEMEGISTGTATTGNIFRYDSASNQYIFNLSTKPLSTGTWRIRIELDDGTSKTATIGLR